MKKLTLLAAALLVSACGDKGNDPAATSNQPLTQVAAPNGDWTKAVTQTPEGGMLMGNPNAKVKLVEFGSMSCSHCAEFAEKDEPKLVNNYVKSGQVSYEFRNFVRDPLDITMSLIARCAGANPQFFQLTQAMYADQANLFQRLQAVPEQQLQALQTQPPAQQFQNYARLAGLQEWAAQRGLPSAKTNQCLSNQAEIERLVQMNSDTTTQYPQFEGTPGFVINGKFVGSLPWDQLEPQIRGAVGS